jgi:hypothetical protein
MIEPGCYYAFGITGTGKTYKVGEMLAGYIRERGCGYAIIDSGPATAYAREPHVPSKEVVLERVVAGYSAIYTPRSLSEVAYILRGLHYYGQSAVLWDEVANDLAGAPHNSEDVLTIARVVRCWRQAGLAFDPDGRPNFYGLTTQNPQELPRVFWSTGAVVFGFRLEEEEARGTLDKRCRFPSAELFSLPDYEYLTLGKDRKVCRSPGAPIPAAPPPAVPSAGSGSVSDAQRG